MSSGTEAALDPFLSLSASATGAAAPLPPVPAAAEGAATGSEVGRCGEEVAVVVAEVGAEAGVELSEAVSLVAEDTVGEAALGAEDGVVAVDVDRFKVDDRAAESEATEDTTDDETVVVVVEAEVVE